MLMSYAEVTTKMVLWSVKKIQTSFKFSKRVKVYQTLLHALISGKEEGGQEEEEVREKRRERRRRGEKIQVLPFNLRNKQFTSLK